VSAERWTAGGVVGWSYPSSGLVYPVICTDQPRSLLQFRILYNQLYCLVGGSEPYYLNHLFYLFEETQKRVEYMNVPFM
jgi:hypothetical protein